MYKKNKTTCENCLGDFIFTPDDLYGEIYDDGQESSFHIECPFCGFENDMYYLEEYGIELKELLENGQLESRDKNKSQDW